MFSKVVFCRVIPGVNTLGITLQRTSVSCIGHSYPELLEVLYDIHTRTRKFWKFCTPVPQIPAGYRYIICITYVGSVRVLQFNTRNFCGFCNTAVLLYPEFPFVL